MKLPFFIDDNDNSLSEFVLIANPGYERYIHYIVLKADGSVHLVHGVCYDVCLVADGKYRIHEVDDNSAQIHLYDLKSVGLFTDELSKNKPFTVTVTRERGVFAFRVGSSGKIAEDEDWPYLMYDTRYVFDPDPLTLGKPIECFAAFSDGKERFSEHYFYWRDGCQEMTAKELAQAGSTKKLLPYNQSTFERNPAMSRVSLPETTKFLLWVNDNPSMSRSRFDEFATRGVVIASAQSTKKAMQLLGRAQYDAVITDLRRNEHGKKNENAGIDLTQQIRRSNAHVPIFIYTMNLDSSTVQLAKNSGATLITANPAELEEALKQYGLI